ncbi:hypothetical protein LCI18_010038 [Fusarium solani-melongenae]|uniref:Uncharacterized protein n=1 Tax=Fusarium solani subsp. cucurbitae TaxID=2747967 RepID=A0ACD3ZDG1_FUSSC|nr:hypothetical protein LCI18_010038 [Fusarium solani-melongenae]
MGSDKENRKRHRSPERQHPPNFTSDDFTFERRPRHKTRPDRYDSRKRDDGRARAAKSEAKGARKQARAKKSRLRSSRDVMHNFTSSFLGTSRITLDPELRAGMSSNVRSSAYAGRELGDLRFNEMRFLEKPEEPAKGHSARNSQEIRQEGNRNGFERHLVHPSSPRQSSPALSTITSRSAGSGRLATQPQEARPTSHNTSWGSGYRGISFESCHGSILGKSSSLPQRGRSGSVNQAVSVRGSKTPECVPKELIKTGVFSGTGILSRLGHHRKQPSTVPDTNDHTSDPVETSKSHPRRRISYEDRGVMVSPEMERSERPNQQLPATADHSHQNTTAGTPLSTNPLNSEQQSKDLPMPSGDPNRVEADNPNPSEASRCLDSGEQATDGKGHQAPTCPVPTQADKGSCFEKRPESISETSEGGHHYIRSVNQGLDFGIGPDSSLRKDRPSVQPLPQRLSTPQSWEHAAGHPRHHGWRRHQGTPAPLSDFGTRYPESLHHRVSTLTPIYEQDEILPNEKDPGVLRQYNSEETMMEFIKRIDNEVIMERWNESQDSYGVAMGGDNFEASEITRPASRNSRPPLQQREPSGQGRQGSFVDWNNHLNAPRRFLGRTATDEDCAEAEAVMISFWRPNRF